MEKRPLAEKSHPRQSPSPEAPTEDGSRLQSIVRSSRATSEERSDYVRSPNSYDSQMSESQMAAYRNSRAGSEAPQREDTLAASGTSPQRLGGGAAASYSQRSSRAGSEAPDRNQDILSAKSSRAGSEAPQRDGLGNNDSFRSTHGGMDAPDRSGNTPQNTPKRTTKKSIIPQPPTTKRTTFKHNVVQQISNYGQVSIADRVRAVEEELYHTLPHTSGGYRYFQQLHYPLSPEVPEEVPPSVPTTSNSSSSPNMVDENAKEPSPQPRLSGGSAGSLGSEKSPSPTFDEAAFGARYGGAAEMLGEGGEALTTSFSMNPHVDEVVHQSVSVLAFTTLPDPVSGAPVLGVCMGDYNGRVEYFEASTADGDNKRIRKSKSFTKSRSRTAPLASLHRDPSYMSEDGKVSVDSEATVNIMQDMRGREVARRHSHKAYVKSINALTSVAVEPCVKCLRFIRNYNSPSVVSYLTANERVIKLFHVRRDGFTPFSVFPGMEHVVPRTLQGSRYFARLPPPQSIVPVKEFGPSQNSIQALSMSADGETFMSVEDLQVFWWHLEATDTTKATCIADLRPPSGALDEVEELVTAASFHPTHSSLFMLSRSSGVLNIGDLRDPPSRAKRQYAITTQVHPMHNPVNCAAYDEILCSISAASFLGPDHVVTRDYLSLKLWDLRRPDSPYMMVPVMDYVKRYLDPLYENDSIFDRFPVAVDDVSGTVVTGLYDGAVAVWQPLNKQLRQEEELVQYRVDPDLAPPETKDGARITVAELDARLEKSWRQVRIISDPDSMGNDLESVPEPFTNKVLDVAIAPGGERFGYTYKNGKLVYILERY
ncbi:hypothetical protein STCU_07738 [Strigomonas culicis]|uniref:Protein phosphatase 2 (Formerly 2A), regulatory subunit B n=1 Tax=Strigomonas culicis TaxID=28005 RepID=S9U3J2_9TRYP|nr:hypothetical protein STCU_07738 [Strigomonas culicis]|eukprot:EPY23384.1 hypothetical protein STCU_07738 [Strigomonas culicis]